MSRCVPDSVRLDSPEERQLRREADELEQALVRLRHSRANLVLTLDDLTQFIATRQRKEAGKRKPLISLLSIAPAKLALITLRELFRAAMGIRGRRDAPDNRTQVARSIGARCRVERSYDRIRGRAYDVAQLLITSSRNKNPWNAEVRGRQLARRADAAWSDKQQIAIGAILIKVAVASLSVFELLRREKRPPVIAFTESGMRVAAHHLRSIGLLPSRDLPMVCKPVRWDSLEGGGYLTNRETGQTSLVEHHGNIQRLNQLHKADLSLVLVVVNGLQETPWRINKDVLDVLEHAYKAGTPWPGLPAERRHPVPQKPPEGSHDKLVKRWATDYARASRFNSGLFAKKAYVRLVSELAATLKDEVLYFPYFLDSRGRLYPLPQDLHPQSADVGRALLEFVRGERLGARGEEWLAIHLANKYGKDKLPFCERVQWVRDNERLIRNLAGDPGRNLDFWKEAKKPWQFFAACKEWDQLRREGAGFESHLPVAMDGTANVLQHVSAMTLDASGARMTNLVASEDIADFYTLLLADVQQRVREDIAAGNRVAEEWGRDRVTRQLIKDVVMQWVYGGEGGNIDRKLIEKGHLDHLPALWEEDESRPSKGPGAKYLREVVCKRLEILLSPAAHLRRWEQKIADIFSSKNQGFGWETPSGFPVWHEYRKQIRSRLRIPGGGVYVLYCDGPESDSARQSNAILANFVHSFDAAHLVLTVSRLHREGLRDFATVHDSYAVHACDVDRLQIALREEFAKIYRRPVLREFLAGLKTEITQTELPDPPEGGKFVVEKVRNSQYFFC